MTYRELRAERRLEKIRAKIVRDELKRIDREQEVAHTILDIMTAVLLAMLVISAMVVDEYGMKAIPDWVYAIGIGYVGTYVILGVRRLNKRR